MDDGPRREVEQQTPEPGLEPSAAGRASQAEKRFAAPGT